MNHGSLLRKMLYLNLLFFFGSSWFMIAADLPETPDVTADSLSDSTPTDDATTADTADTTQDVVDPAQTGAPTTQDTTEPTDSETADDATPEDTTAETTSDLAATPATDGATPTPTVTDAADGEGDQTTDEQITPTVQIVTSPTAQPEDSSDAAAVSEQTTPTVDAVPVAPEQEKVETPTAPLRVVEGIDTVDIEEGGNWLLKRKALEDTADTIEKIVNTFSKILEASTSFKIKRNKLDNDYDLYLATVGFNLGDLDQVLTDLLDELERERTEEGDLSADERQAQTTITEKKNEIQQLKKELQALSALDVDVDKLIDTVDSQIKTANNYQNQAWKNFQQIKKVLSDEKAEELYYRTVSLQKSMQDIYAYLTGTLSTYFSSQIDTMRTQMDSVKSKIQSLQSKGVDLQKQVEAFEQADEQRDEDRAKAAQEEAVERAVMEAKKKAEQSSWWHWFKGVISWPFVQLKNIWNYSVSLVMSPFAGKTAKKAEMPSEQTPATEPDQKENAQE